PLLIIATTRPEFRPAWKQRSHHGVISLAPLDAGEVARMVGEIATRHALSKDVIAGVSERSGGVPLFVEEVTRLVLERGEAGGVQAIPPTLQQSLAARLDPLRPARGNAQVGAALAHHFTQAGQTELAIEWWGKAGDQALRRSAFAEAISHLGKAIELSDKAVGAARPRKAAATASGGQPLKLHAT